MNGRTSHVTKLDYRSNADRFGRGRSLTIPLVGLLVCGGLTAFLAVVAARAYAGEAGDVMYWAVILGVTSALGFSVCFAWLAARLRPLD
jgi:hypothetical protein